MTIRTIPFVLISCVLLTAGCQRRIKVDLIVYNAKIYTVDEQFSVQEAFAVKDGKFVDIGRSDEISQRYGADEVIDANGLPVYPGFYDAHAHFYGFAHTLMQADLVGAESFDEVVQRLVSFREEFPESTWLVGHGWDQNLWSAREFPNRSMLDAAFPDIPVYITRVDWHAALANTKALELAGITSPTAIVGGEFAMSDGRLTGILIDNAMQSVSNLIPEPTNEERLKLLRKAEEACLAVGLTTVNDAGLDRAELDFLRSLYQKQELQIRNHAMVNISEENLDHYLTLGPYVSERLTIRVFKILADGALGSRGACLLAPYSDAPTTQGFLLFDEEEIDRALSRIVESEFQVATHAIGDSTNRLILDAYAKYLEEPNDRRWRIEHAQIVAPEDFRKFGDYSILASVQPIHATSDMYWAIDRIGTDRLRDAYAYQQLLDQTGTLSLGSDFPVESINPLYGFHAAVARTDAAGMPQGGFQMENAISREDALRGMTIWAAHSFFEENERGSIELGKKADFVILADDLLTAPSNKLRDITVNRTVILGQTVYSSK